MPRLTGNTPRSNVTSNLSRYATRPVIAALPRDTRGPRSSLMASLGSGSLGHVPLVSLLLMYSILGSTAIPAIHVYCECAITYLPIGTLTVLNGLPRSYRNATCMYSGFGPPGGLGRF